MWLQAQTFFYLLIFFSCGRSTVTKSPSTYQFGYTVSEKATGDFKSHHEESDSKEVRGTYSLVEPTGDLRVVTYKADRANGFRATVNVHPQPTPKYRPLELRQRHVESHSTKTAIQEDVGLADGGETMAVVAEVPITNRSLSQINHESGGASDNTAVEHKENPGSQMITIKVQEESAPPSIDPAIREPVLKVQESPNTPGTAEENLQLTAQNASDKNKTTGSQVEYEASSKEKHNLTKPVETQKTNTSILPDVIKPTVKPAETSSEMKPNQTSLYSSSTAPQHRPDRTVNPTQAQPSPETSVKKVVTSTSDGKFNMDDIKNNNMMLAALLLPTTPILKFTCTPDHSDKDNSPMMPTPNFANLRSQPPIPLGPGGPLITSSIPLFPFQLVNFSPIKQIFSPQNKFTAQKPIFTSNAPLLPTLSTIFSSKPPVATAAAQQNSESPHKKEDASAAPKLTGGYSDVRAPHNHHFLPPPWAPHPLHHPSQQNFRHMPIFVLPMSHNSDFAPVFDPSTTDHNH